MRTLNWLFASQRTQSVSEARKKILQNEFMFMFGVELRIEFTEINEKRRRKKYENIRQKYTFLCVICRFCISLSSYSVS